MPAYPRSPRPRTRSRKYLARDALLALTFVLGIAFEYFAQYKTRDITVIFKLEVWALIIFSVTAGGFISLRCSIKTAIIALLTTVLCTVSVAGAIFFLAHPKSGPIVLEILLSPLTGIPMTAMFLFVYPLTGLIIAVGYLLIASVVNLICKRWPAEQSE